MDFINSRIRPKKQEKLEEVITSFFNATEPVEKNFVVFTDFYTNAYYIEIHILASRLVELGTVDVPLDPEEQAEYRANRELSEDHNAFIKMKLDALEGRTFSNIIAEYCPEEEKYPIKIIGGQHRYVSIKDALEGDPSQNQYHGLKVYFDLDTQQRLDIQLISNTNIDVSPDLLDRMYETVKGGPQLRNWCQRAGFLESGQDFADKRQKTTQITVRMARSFILSYFEGAKVDPKSFSQKETNPIIASTGGNDANWDELRLNSEIFQDEKLLRAAQAYNKLCRNQIKFYLEKNKRQRTEYAYKAYNYAILSSWAYISGVLKDNELRLERHFQLGVKTDEEPFQAAILAKGRHKSDPQNYRGLGTRTDKKERGRLAELFFLQAEKGTGITKKLIELALSKYYLKLAAIDVSKIESSLDD
jgi:hypothetical protein